MSIERTPEDVERFSADMARIARGTSVADLREQAAELASRWHNLHERGNVISAVYSHPHGAALAALVTADLASTLQSGAQTVGAALQAADDFASRLATLALA